MQCMPRGLFGRRRKVGTAQPPAPDSPAARPPSPVRPAHDSSVSSPTEANSGPGPPSHRPLSHVKDGAGDTPSQQEPPPGPEPTSHAGVEPARNPTPAPSSDASSVKPAPIQDPLLSPAPAWGPEDHAESLWAAAYDSLREQEPDLVRQYELDVYACISTPDRRDFALGRLAGIILSRPGDAEIPLPETGHLMSSFVEAYLCEPDQDCRSDTVKKDDLDSPGLETEGVDGKGLRCLWDGMRAVMRRSQYASIPWVASCIALESLFHSSSQPDLSKSQAITLLLKMEWYIGLSKLFFEEDRCQAQHAPCELDSDSRVGALLHLYRAVLSYQIHAASCAFGSRYLNRASIELADLGKWEKDVRIRDEELAVFGARDLGVGLTEELGVARNLEPGAAMSVDGDTGKSYGSGLDKPSDSGSGALSVSDLAVPADGEEDHTGAPTEKLDSEADQVRALLQKLDMGEQTIPRLNMDEDTAPTILYRGARAKPQFKRLVSPDAEPGDRVLWIEGGPGAGKTQLLQAAVKWLPEEGQGGGAPGPAWTGAKVAYFFCDSSIPGRDSALAVVKGLICHVLHAQPPLRSCLEKLVSGTKRRRFDEPSDFYPMATVLHSLLDDEVFRPTYFVVDAIEELVPDKHACPAGSPASAGGPVAGDPLDSRGLDDLLGLISTTAEVSDKIRWLVSVDRGRRGRLVSVKEDAGLCITVSPDLEAAGKYVSSRLAELADKQNYWGRLRGRMEKRIREAGIGNFLWLKLALDIMGESRTPWHAPQILDKLLESSPDVDSLYRQRMPEAAILGERHAAYCTDILSAAAVAYRPLLASELVSIVGLPEEVDLGILIAEFLPSFLELYEDREAGEERVRFSHLAARDFVRREGTRRIPEAHLFMVENCLRILLAPGRTPDGTEDEGGSADETSRGDGRPNDYAIVYWLRHLLELDDEGKVAVKSRAADVLELHWFRWLEILDSRGRLSEALDMLDKTETALTTKASTPKKQSPQKAEGPKSRIHQAIANVGGFIRVHRMWMSDGEQVSPKHSLLYWRNERPRWLARAPTFEATGAAPDGCRLVIHHPDWVRACGFSPDGRLVATGSDDGLVRLWDTEAGKLQGVPGRFDGFVYSISVSISGPAGRPLLAASGTSSIKIWDLTTGVLMEDVTGPDVDAANKRRDKDGEDGAETGVGVSNGEGGGEGSSSSSTTSRGFSVGGVAITAAGDRLAAATADCVMVWDLPGFRKTELRDDSEAWSPRRVSFSPDGRLLAVSAGSEITIWDTTAGEVLRRLPERKPRQPDGVPEEAETNGDKDGQPNGEIAKDEEPNEAGPGEDGSDRKGSEEELSEEGRSESESSSDDKSSEELRPEEGPGHFDDIDGLAFSPDSKFLASGSDDRTARIWNVDTGATEAVFRHDRGYINSVAFSADGSRLVTADSTVGVWRRDTDGGWGGGGLRTQPDRVLEGHSFMVLAAAFAPRGRLLATGGFDKDVRVWDMDAAEEQVAQLHGDVPHPAEEAAAGHARGVELVEISPGGETVASAAGGGEICLWDGVTGALRLTMKGGHETSVTALVFSRDGARLVSTSTDRTACVWDVADGDGPVFRLEGHDDWVRGAAVSPDGRLVATASDDRTVRVWDVGARPGSGGEEEAVEVPVRVLRGHTDYVYGVAFSPNGGRLASVGDDRHVLIWDLAGEGDKSGPDRDMSDTRASLYLRGVVFSAGGGSVITVDSDGNVAAWNPRRREWEQGVPVGDKADYPFTMRIDEERPDVLLTSVGAWPFDVSEAALERLASGSEEQLPRRRERPAWAPLGVDAQARWISWHDKRLIYLPPGFRPAQSGFSCQLVHGLSAVVGCGSGRVLLFRLSEEVGPDDPPDAWWAQRSVS